MGGLWKGFLLAVVALCAFASPAAADHSLIHLFEESEAGYPCPAYPAEGDLRICSAQVPSFDGAELDVDLTLPMNDQRRAGAPLIVMLHGLGGNKRNWESTRDEGNEREKWHWNSHWFAKHGYYVLTYTARGHRDDRPSGDEPPTPGEGSLAGPRNTAHLKSEEFEIRDTQWLSALVADAFPEVDPNRVAVTGGSYGGGESWMQASQAEWTFPNERDPSLPVLSLQVSVPIIGWTDLGYSAVPNGHGGGPSGADHYESSIGHPDSPVGAGHPVGVMKESYLDALFVLGNTELVWEEGAFPGEQEGPHPIPLWYSEIKAGDPYNVNGVDKPIIAQARRGVTEFRSSYYQDEEWDDQQDDRKVAIFAIQGWQDDLFPAVEAFRQFKYLKRLDPRWPIALALADLGHSRGQNKPKTWQRVNDQSWQFLQAHINGSHEQQTTVYSEPTICANDGEPDNNLNASMRLTATTPEGLSNGALNITYQPGATVSPGPTPGEDLDNVKSDPSPVGDAINNEPCRESEQPTAPRRYTGVSPPLRDSSTYVGLGHVTLDDVVLPPVTAVLNARVWDVAPDGTTLLVTRGTYRIDPTYPEPPGPLRLPLFGNHWRFEPGHRIRIDLTQSDNPTFRASNLPSTIEFGPPRLTLPTREAATRTLP